MQTANLTIFDGSANPELVKKVCSYLGVKSGDMNFITFSDGELGLNIHDSVRGSDVFVIQPTCFPASENLIKLFLCLDALKRASAERITAIIPYYGYSRQEKKTQPREPISAKLFANLISASGADRIITMDLHTPAIQGFFDIPVDHLYGAPILIDFFKKELKNYLNDAIVVSPDAGGVARARKVAQKLQLDLAIIDKRRPKHNEAAVMNIIGKVKGVKTAIIIDDIIDTGGTIVKSATALAKKGIENIYVSASHGIFSGEAIKKIENSVIKKVIVTDSIPHQQKNVFKKLKVASIAPLLGEAIKRIHLNLSVSMLFD